VHIAGFTLIYFVKPLLGEAYPARVLMSAPKRQFREAVQRNRVKRLLRESWRLRKHRLYEVLRERNEQLLVMLSCKTKEIPSHAAVEEAIELLLERLIRKLIEKGGPR
jgi:ribonuclease P protein component